MEWKIREITIPNKLVLAPMAGITNEAFRIICKEMGAGLLVAEMVSDKAIGFQNERTLKMTKVNPLEHPVSMQIFGGDVESLVNDAKYIDEFSDADIIDINIVEVSELIADIIITVPLSLLLFGILYSGKSKKYSQVLSAESCERILEKVRFAPVVITFFATLPFIVTLPASHASFATTLLFIILLTFKYLSNLILFSF